MTTSLYKLFKIITNVANDFFSKSFSCILISGLLVQCEEVTSSERCNRRFVEACSAQYAARVKQNTVFITQGSMRVDPACYEAEVHAYARVDRGLARI